MRKYIYYSLFLLALSFISCEEEEIPRPIVSSDEVGFVNETSLSANWGISFAGNSERVDSKRSSTMPYSDSGYWVYPINASGSMRIYPSRSQIIVLYEDGDLYRLTLE